MHNLIVIIGPSVDLINHSIDEGDRWLTALRRKLEGREREDLWEAIEEQIIADYHERTVEYFRELGYEVHLSQDDTGPDFYRLQRELEREHGEDAFLDAWDTTEPWDNVPVATIALDVLAEDPDDSAVYDACQKLLES